MMQTGPFLIKSDGTAFSRGIDLLRSVLELRIAVATFRQESQRRRAEVSSLLGTMPKSTPRLAVARQFPPYPKTTRRPFGRNEKCGRMSQILNQNR